MTITLNNSNPVQYAGDGSTVTFSYPWKLSAATDLIVGFIVSGVYTQQTLGSAYTVANVGNNGGGSITFAAAPSVGTTVDLRPLTPETQSTEFANLAAYLPENSTNVMDRIVRMIQDLTRLAYTFGIHGPDQESVPWTALPSAAARANSILAFDGNGLPIIASAAGSTFTTQQAYTATGGQTAFTLPVSVSSSVTLLVSLNGSVQVPGDDYTTAGNVLTLLTAASSGDRLNVLAIVA